MKKSLFYLVALLFLAGQQLLPCKADPFLGGGIYEDTTVPFANGVAETYNRVGKAQCKNVLNMVQLGDCSINTAIRQGHIKNVHHIDVHREGSFIFKKITTNVYGE